ncbi:MAG: PDZ domain-containing protein, partial [Pirellulaceae bacterium]|nr:PDZ domain-containing protein [Pirellulaceae bacterium]
GTRETSRSIESFRAADVRSADFGIWFNRSTTNGLIISDISTRGPIAKLGFRDGDRIISVNGQKVVRDADFVTYLFAEDIRNDRVEVIVFRGGKQVIVYVEPTVLIQDYYAVQVDPLESFGVILDDRYSDRIVIWRVVPRSPAYYAGIRGGDVLVSFRGERIASADAFVKLVQNVEPGNVAVEVMRDKQTREYEVELPRLAARAGADVDVDVRRPNDRREGRIEERREERKEDRVEDKGDETVPPKVVPGTPAAPAAPRPGILPRRPR